MLYFKLWDEKNWYFGKNYHYKLETPIVYRTVSFKTKKNRIQRSKFFIKFKFFLRNDHYKTTRPRRPKSFLRLESKPPYLINCEYLNNFSITTFCKPYVHINFHLWWTSRRITSGHGFGIVASRKDAELQLFSTLLISLISQKTCLAQCFLFKAFNLCYVGVEGIKYK